MYSWRCLMMFSAVVSMPVRGVDAAIIKSRDDDDDDDW